MPSDKLIEEIGRREAVCEAGFKRCPVPIDATYLPNDGTLTTWHKANKLAREDSRNHRSGELAALRKAVQTMTFIVEECGTHDARVRPAVFAALAAIAKELGVSDVE